MTASGLEPSRCRCRKSHDTRAPLCDRGIELTAPRAPAPRAAGGPVRTASSRGLFGGNTFCVGGAPLMRHSVHGVGLCLIRSRRRARARAGPHPRRPASRRRRGAPRAPPLPHSDVTLKLSY